MSHLVNFCFATNTLAQSTHVNRSRINEVDARETELWISTCDICYFQLCVVSCRKPFTIRTIMWVAWALEALIDPSVDLSLSANILTSYIINGGELYDVIYFPFFFEKLKEAYVWQTGVPSDTPGEPLFRVSIAPLSAPGRQLTMPSQSPPCTFRHYPNSSSTSGRPWSSSLRSSCC